MAKQHPEDLLLHAHFGNLTADGVPVTLFVKGSLISGTAVPLSTYLRAVFLKEDDLEVMADALAKVEAMEQELRELKAREFEELSKSERKKVGQPSFFINLVNAHWQAPDGQMAPTSQGLNIRVRASSIDAWTAGTVGVSRG